jgi:TetR/AcrR family transcriptional regulator
MLTPSVRLPTEQRQAHIVAAAVDLAGRIGPAAVTTGDIARAIGVTQGSLFKHFQTKEAIWLAVMEWVTQQLLERLEAAAGPPAPALDALGRVFRAHVDFVLEHPGVPRLIFHELQQAAGSPVKRQLTLLLQSYRELLTGLLQTARDCGEVPAGLDLQASVTLFVGIVQGLVMQSMLAGHGGDMQADAERVFPLYLRSMREAA